MGASGEIELLAFPKWDLLPRVFGSPIDGTVAWHSDGRLRELSVEPKAGTWFSNGSLLMFEVEHNGELYENRWLSADRGGFFFRAPWTRWLSTSANFSTGEAALYDPEDPSIGWSSRGGMRVQLQPSTHLTLSPEINWEQFELAGEEVYNGWVGRLKLEAFATPQIWGRILVDRSTFSHRSSLESLIAYEREPGKAMYLGGSVAREGDSEQSEERDTLWQVFTKLSWVFGS